VKLGRELVVDIEKKIPNNTTTIRKETAHSTEIQRVCP